MKKLILLVTIGFVFGLSQPIIAQKGYTFPDSVKYKKNIIKWNLTPFVLWSKKNISLSYERVVNPYRSFSVNAGYFELPLFAEAVYDSLEIQRTTKRSGYAFSGDYRFYFKSLNRGMAPDGLYWGPYGSFHHTELGNDITVINNPTFQGDLIFGAKINILSLGVELGYQFIIKERLAIDLIFMGPSLTMYNMNFTLGGEFEADMEDEYLQAIYDILAARIPGFEKLVDEGELTTSAANVSMGFGLRYMIQIGYRF